MNSSRKSSVFIPAGLFIGLGIGIAMDHPAVGLFIGLGVGLLVSTLVTMKKTENH